MLKIKLSLGINNCFHLKTTYINKKESFLIDTGFSSYLCLAKKFKKNFPNLKGFSSFEVEFILADGSRKLFKQYLVTEMEFLGSELKDILIFFHGNENIIGNQLLKSLGAELVIRFKQDEGYLILN